MQFLLIKWSNRLSSFQAKVENYDSFSHLCLCFDHISFSISCWSGTPYAILLFKKFLIMSNILIPFSKIFFLLFDNAVSIHCVSVDDCPKVEKPITMKCVANYCKYFVDHKFWWRLEWGLNQVPRWWNMEDRPSHLFNSPNSLEIQLSSHLSRHHKL